jgi:hypothetical protein
MRVALVYVFPTVDPAKYCPAARKFVESYMEHPGGAADHELHVIVNGTASVKEARQWFEPLSPVFHSHNNWAKDLGAFYLASQAIDCDLMVCMGSHVNFWKPGWLDVIVNSYLHIGPAVYGAWAFQEPTPHIRTTFFWLPREMLASYPYLESDADRYAFEHGPQSIALWSWRLGFEPFQVTWAGAYSLKHWHAIPIEEALARDQHSLRDFGE